MVLGEYDIAVYNRRVHYFLTVRRNITILEGQSATGKTELIRLISEYVEAGVSSGITLKCTAEVAVLTSADWELRLKSMRGRIIFIDEDASFVHSKRFAELLNGSDNYFVIITRDELKGLPYAIDEIYGLRNVTDANKYKSFKRVYNETYRLYSTKISHSFIPDVVITEDSNSGFEFFNILYPGKCVSAKGKSNIYEKIRKNAGKKILAIVDSAAFGCEIGKIMRYFESGHAGCVIYAPESFEYLILVSGIIDVPEAVTEKTYNYADSTKYMSWEEFYESYLVEKTRNTVSQYSKARLPEYYKTAGTVKKVSDSMPPAIIT